MTDQEEDTSLETCPACHGGVLVRVEVRADNICTQYFSCGHAKHQLEFGDKLEMHGSMAYEVKSKGRGKSHVEGKTGEEFFRKAKKWVQKIRLIDREKNYYKELVTDPETGQIIHECEEPLTAHKGHGSVMKENKAKG